MEAVTIHRCPVAAVFPRLFPAVQVTILQANPAPAATVERVREMPIPRCPRCQAAITQEDRVLTRTLRRCLAGARHPTQGSILGAPACPLSRAEEALARKGKIPAALLPPSLAAALTPEYNLQLECPKLTHIPPMPTCPLPMVTSQTPQPPAPQAAPAVTTIATPHHQTTKVPMVPLKILIPKETPLFQQLTLWLAILSLEP